MGKLSELEERKLGRRIDEMFNKAMSDPKTRKAFLKHFEEWEPEYDRRMAMKKAKGATA